MSIIFNCMVTIFYIIRLTTWRHWLPLLNKSRSLASSSCEMMTIGHGIVCRALWSTCWKWHGYWGSRACCRSLTAIISTASSYWHCWWLYSQFWHIGWRVSGILLDERNSSSTLPTGLLVCIDVGTAVHLDLTVSLSSIKDAKSWHSLSAIVLISNHSARGSVALL